MQNYDLDLTQNLHPLSQSLMKKLDEIEQADANDFLSRLQNLTYSNYYNIEYCIEKANQSNGLVYSNQVRDSDLNKLEAKKKSFFPIFFDSS
jgi:hypothetical protein